MNLELHKPEDMLPDQEGDIIVIISGEIFKGEVFKITSGIAFYMSLCPIQFEIKACPGYCIDQGKPISSIETRWIPNRNK